MHDDELDTLLRKLPGGSPAPEEADMPLDDGVLIAFRDGNLSAGEAEAIERRLARDPDARLLLRELSAQVAVSDVDDVVSRVTPQAKVLPFARKRALWLATAATLAAGLLLVVVTRQPAQLGAYQLEVEGGDATLRGSEEKKTRVLGPESRLTVRLRAEAPSDAPRVLGVFVEGAQGALTRVTAGQLDASRGSFALQLEGNTWLPTAGRQKLWLVIADDEATLRGVEVPGGARWWSLDVERRDE